MSHIRPLVGIGVLIFNDQNQILLGSRVNAHGSNVWGPPGGHLEFGESFEACACREVREEVGLDISSPVFLAVTNDFFKEENKHYVSIFMKCFFPEGQMIQNLEPHKATEWKWCDWDNLPPDLFLPLRNLKAHNY